MSAKEAQITGQRLSAVKTLLSDLLSFCGSAALGRAIEVQFPTQPGQVCACACVNFVHVFMLVYCVLCVVCCVFTP